MHQTKSNLAWTIVIFFILYSCKPIKTEVDIKMHDGVKLSTDVYVPKGSGKYPAILVRTPYDKSNEAWLGVPFGMKNIAVVVQDVRGKFKSEGNFYPFINEREDGLETLEWIKKQSWSNGFVGGWGTSYLGYTQWAVSDSLDFMAQVLTGANMYDLFYPDGLFSLQSAFTWGLQNASSGTDEISVENLKKSFGILPLSTADDSVFNNVHYLNDWLKHESNDNYWRDINFRGKIKGSLLAVAGWYDIFLKAQIRDFQTLVENGDTESRLIIGPWCHGSQGIIKDYGGEKNTGKPRKLFFYAAKKMKGKNAKLSSPLKNKRYNLFIMERNEYFSSDEWPPRETSMIPYYIGPDNYLKKNQYTTKGVLEFVYDPSNPYPSFGGTALGDGVGPAKQNGNINRSDQVVFQTEVLEEPLILLGPISATLWLSSDAPCTDFFVCLEDVYPDGTIINIQEGGAKVIIENEQPEKKEISVWATGYQLNTGHRLKVVITSSWFPRFNRNLNNCDSIYNATEARIARQKVFYGNITPSSINLPVLELNDN